MEVQIPHNLSFSLTLSMAGEWSYENSCQKGQPRNRFNEKPAATFLCKKEALKLLHR
jgi:hypothetical protein